jgi:hypothetical protein
MSTATTADPNSRWLKSAMKEVERGGVFALSKHDRPRIDEITASLDSSAQLAVDQQTTHECYMANVEQLHLADGIIGSQAKQIVQQQRRIEELEGAAENNRRLVWCAIQNAKRMPETWDEVGDPGPYNGPLWARVAHLLGLGSTSATALCREHGEDPEWRAALQPQGENNG